jgi:signal transduction histidine kinase
MTAALVTVLSIVGVHELAALGSQAESITSDSMRKRVEELLVQTVNATAEKNSAKFSSIQASAANVAEYLQNVFDRPNDFPRGTWSFNQHVTERPGGVYANSATELASVYVAAGTPLTPLLKQRLELSGYLDYLVPQILKSQSDAVAVYYMGSVAGESRYYPNIDLASITPPDFSITAQEFFQVATPQLDPTKETKWTSVYDDPAGHGLTITASSPMYNGGAFSGAIGMDVTLNNIAKNIEDYSPIESSYAFLIDTKGRAVALPRQGYQDLLGREPKKGEFGSDLSGVDGDFRSILTQMRAGKQGFGQPQNRAHEGLYVAYAPVTGTPFSLAIVVRQAASLKVVNDLRSEVGVSTRLALYGRFLPLGAAGLLLVWWLGSLVIRRINGPIHELTQKTAEVASGNLEVQPASTSARNEIGQLATSFNRMVAELLSSRKKIADQNRRLLENEQSRLEASINSLRIGFIMTDQKNRVIMLNEAARKILKLKPNDNADTAAISAQLGEAVAFAQNLERVARTQQPHEQKEADYRDTILRVFMAPVLGGVQGARKAANLGVVVLLEDITEAKLLERSKDEFFSIASHELRTPLTAVRGNAVMLQTVYGIKIHERDFDEMVGDIHGASVRLIEIVNDFLDATRLEQGRIRFELADVDIKEVVKTVMYEMATVAKEKGVKLVAGPGLSAAPAVHADKNRVKQIIYNLMGNALKFTEKGNITIDARVEGTKLKVLVKDNGPGIAEENQRLLFRKFQQASNSFITRESRGTGLGLYISKLLSEQMGGRIALEESALGKGTTFSFTVPLAKSSRTK